MHSTILNKIVLGLLAVSACACVFGADAKPQKHSPRGTQTHYWSGEFRVDLDLALDELQIEYDNDGPSANDLKSVPGFEKVESINDGKKQSRVQFKKVQNAKALNAQAASLRKLKNVKTAAAVGYQPQDEQRTSREVFSTRIVLKLKDGQDLDAILKKHKLKFVEAVKFAPGANIVSADESDVLAALETANAIYESGAAEFAYPLTYKQQQRRFTPNDPYFQPPTQAGELGQWHLSGAQTVNVLTVWDTYRGTGINIAVTDDGLQVGHPDLAPNARTNIDIDINYGDDDPTPDKNADNHGTSVGGVAAARGDNGIGVTGAAPLAGLIGVRLISAASSDADEAQAMLHQHNAANPADRAYINTNSWGPQDNGAIAGTTGPLIKQAWATGTSQGRGGKGMVYLFAAGNGGVNDNSNYDNYANSRYVIAVAASNSNGVHSNYSEPGANILINAPSNDNIAGPLGITTTDRTASAGYDKGPQPKSDYTATFGGTSSASPLAAGVIALILESNPNLSWRDVQHILVNHSQKIDLASGTYFTNAAGKQFSHNYGFGRINAGMAVTAATNNWVLCPPEEASPLTASEAVVTTIPDDNTTVTRTLNISGPNDFKIEHIEFTVNLTHTYRGDIRYRLVSPSGTTAEVTKRGADGTDNLVNWTFTSVAQWGENPNGTWQLLLNDVATPDSGTLNSWSLKIYGYRATPPSISSLSPSLAAQGTQGLTLTVNGAGFTYDSTVNWNGTPLTTTFVNRSQITAVVPAANFNVAGTFPITVTQANFDGAGGGTSAAQNFFVIGSVWDKGGANNNWTTSLNWASDVQPASSTVSMLSFPAVGASAYTASNDIANPFTLNQILLTGAIDGNTISGNPLSLSGSSPAISQSGSGAFTISAPLVLNSSTSLSGNGSGLVSLNGGISGAGTLTKYGSSSFAIGGTNTYSAATTVSAGTLFFNGSLNSSANGVSVSSGATLRGTGTISRALSGSGTVFPGSTTGVSSTKGTLTASSANLSSGIARVRVYSAAVDTIPTADKLALTGGLTLGGSSTLQLDTTVVNGTYNDRRVEVISTAAGQITQPFNAVQVNTGSATTGIAVLYISSGSGTIVATQAPGQAASASSFSADRVVVQLNGTVTPATIESFSATADGDGVLLEWLCQSEFQNVGFNIWRRDAGAGKAWTKINATLIPGRLTTPDAKLYRHYDWIDAGQYEYRLETISLQSKSEFFTKSAGPVTVAETNDDAVETMSLEALDTSISTALNDITVRRSQSLMERVEPYQTGIGAPERKLEPVARGQVRELRREVKQQAAAPKAEANAENARVAARAVKTSGPKRGEALKLLYTGSGVISVPQDALPAGYDVRRLKLEREGRALKALAVSGGALVFYGPGYADEYTDKDAVFLRESSTPTQAGIELKAQNLFDAGVNAITSTQETTTVDFHDVYFDWSQSTLNFAPWFSTKFLTEGTAQSFTIDLSNVTTGDATLSVNIWPLAQGTGEQNLYAFVNNTAVGVTTWQSGGKALSLTFNVPSGVFKNGSNTVELLASGAGQMAFVHTISAMYSRTLSGPSTIEFHAEGAAKVYEATNLPGAEAWVVDARDPLNAVLVPYQTQQQNDGSFKLRLSATGGGSGKYLIVPKGSELAPLSITPRVLKPLPLGITYLSTGPAQFGDAVQPLLSARRKEGLAAQFVEQESLFDYYGYGRYGPSGIRNAVRASRPQYLLLLGRTVFDYRDYTPPTVDPLCPTFLISTTYQAETFSDASYGDLGNGYPEVAVGRLAVNTPEDLEVAVAHTLSYGGTQVSGERALIVADRTGEHGNFAAESDALIQAAPDIAWTKAYYGITHPNVSDVTEAMRQAASGGSDLIVYVGHGNSVGLGYDYPKLLDVSSVQSWTGNIVFLQVSCNSNFMGRDAVGHRSIAMEALCQPQGGIAASIGSQGFMTSLTALDFMQQLLKNSGPQSSRWGNALLKAQQWAWQQSGGASGFYRDLSLTQSILGDPALPVHSK